MSLKLKSRIVVFILSFLVWLAITEGGGWQEAAAGVVFSFLVAIIAGQFLITNQRQKGLLHRWISFIHYFLKFLWEMFKANLHVAYIVIHPKLPIKPGIVKIKTKLTKDSAITVLTNSITLTPGTLTVDVNPGKGEIYVHWIDVVSSEVDRATEEIGGKFEKILTEVFE